MFRIFGQVGGRLRKHALLLAWVPLRRQRHTHPPQPRSRPSGICAAAAAVGAFSMGLPAAGTAVPVALQEQPARSATGPAAESVAGPSSSGASSGCGRGCFLAGTLVIMSDGSARPIEELVPGDATAGGTVRATVQVHYQAAAQLYSYKGVTVTGNQAVLDSTAGCFVRVSAAKTATVVALSDLPFGGSVAGTPYSDVVFDLITSDHRIFIYAKHASADGMGTDEAAVVEFADYAFEEGQASSGDQLAQLNEDPRATPAIVGRIATGEANVHVRTSRPPPQVNTSSTSPVVVVAIL